MLLHGIGAYRVSGVDQQHRSGAARGGRLAMVGVPTAFQSFPGHPTGEQHPGKASGCAHGGVP